MYRIYNKSGQTIPVSVCRDGVETRVYLLRREFGLSEALTTVISRLQKRGLLRVEEVPEEVEEVAEEITSTNLLPYLSSLTEEELRELAKTAGIALHGAKKRETLIRKLTEAEGALLYALVDKPEVKSE